jgi:lactoylglutathione lyase
MDEMDERAAVSRRPRLDHVILYVADLDRSTAFYRDMIGLDVKFSEAGYVEFATEGTKFGLYERDRLPGLIGRGPAATGLGGEVLFLEPNVDREAERLADAGVPILFGPVDRPWGQRTVHVLDPDGHVVEFAQPIPRSRPRPMET